MKSLSKQRQPFRACNMIASILASTVSSVRIGKLKIVMRTANYDNDRLTTDPPRAYSSTSSDGGRTWSEALAEPELHNAKSKAYFGRAADGTHIYVYNDGSAQRDKAPGFPNGGRMALRYKIKPPGGAWSAERTFYDTGIKNSYPTLIEVEPGEFRCVWDSGTPDKARTHIHFGKFTGSNGFREDSPRYWWLNPP